MEPPKKQTENSYLWIFKHLLFLSILDYIIVIEFEVKKCWNIFLSVPHSKLWWSHRELITGVKKKTERKNIFLSNKRVFMQIFSKSQAKRNLAWRFDRTLLVKRNLQSARKKCRKGTKRKKIRGEAKSKWTVSETTLLCHFMVQYQFVKIHKSLKCGIDVHVWLNTRTGRRDLNWEREVWVYEPSIWWWRGEKKTTKSDPLKLSRLLIFMISIFSLSFEVAVKIFQGFWRIF